MKTMTQIKSIRLTMVLIAFVVSLLASCNLPAASSDTKTPLPSPSPSPSLTHTILPPTNTLPPLDTSTATATETILYTVGVTFTATPSPLPGVIVRIRNNNDYEINLYRFGISGEIHFLGWLVPRYYGEYQFPDLGRWRIRYCMRDKLGNDLRCWNKFINVISSGKEFSVP